MLINTLIVVLMSLCGIVLGIIMFEIRKIRDRLHLVEGGQASLISTMQFIKEFVTDFKDVHVRLVKLESSRR